MVGLIPKLLTERVEAQGGSEVETVHPRCMHRGEARCEIRVRFVEEGA
jgi:hypothetical protein